MDESPIIMMNPRWGDQDAPSEFGWEGPTHLTYSFSDNMTSSQDYYWQNSNMGWFVYASQMYCIVED
jgi:hypothetical protein